MTIDVLCLRPEADFSRVGVSVPAALKVAYRAPDDAGFPAELKSARALIMPAVGPKLMPALFEGSGLKLIQVTGAGVDRLDRAAIEGLGIPVANVPGGSNAAVAEYVTAAAATLVRRLAWASSEIRRGNYASFRAKTLADNVGGLEGLTAGVVGLGVVGMAVARALHKAGCGIVYYDPHPTDPAGVAAIAAKAVPLAELLACADIVTLHVPLLPATKSLIGAAEIAAMKPTAVLIQASRGGVVDEAALAAALQSGRLGGAAVDVYSSEPPSPDNPLLKLSGEAAERTLLTPHIAGVTRQASAFLFRAAWQNVERVLI
ncbi:MAG: NAD(P)-dependent oxidoreductase, partial [Propylenella sp.]